MPPSLHTGEKLLPNSTATRQAAARRVALLINLTYVCILQLQHLQTATGFSGYRLRHPATQLLTASPSACPLQLLNYLAPADRS